MVPKKEFKTIIKHTPLISVDVILKYHKKILLGKRINKPAQGSYFTVGGIIKKNEPLNSAIKRIVKSELGIEIINELRFIGIFEHFYEDSIFEKISTHYVNIAYQLEVDDFLHKLPQEQHSGYKWFSIDELLKNKNVHQYVKDYFIRKEL